MVLLLCVCSPYLPSQDLSFSGSFQMILILYEKPEQGLQPPHGEMRFSPWLNPTSALLPADDGFKTLWGTSMSTPVVSGAAALVISIIQRLSASNPTTTTTTTSSSSSSSNRGYASFLKPLLLSQSDKLDATAAPGSNQKILRVNVGKAVAAAVKAYGPPGINPTKPLPANTPKGAISMRYPGVYVSGLTERWYLNPSYNATAVAGWRGVAPVDSSSRNGQPPFAGFKYGSGYTLVLTGMLNLTEAGVYQLRLTRPDVQVLVNGVAAAAFPTAGSYRTFVLWVEFVGLYEVELVMVNPSGPLDVLMQNPSNPGERGGGQREGAGGK